MWTGLKASEIMPPIRCKNPSNELIAFLRVSLEDVRIEGVVLGICVSNEELSPSSSSTWLVAL